MPVIARVGDSYSDGDTQATGSSTVFIDNKAVARYGDITQGHDDFPPAVINSASSNVYADGIAVACMGDSHTTHCDDDSCHDGVFVTGSSGVYAGS